MTDDNSVYGKEFLHKMVETNEKEENEPNKGRNEMATLDSTILDLKKVEISVDKQYEELLEAMKIQEMKTTMRQYI